MAEPKPPRAKAANIPSGRPRQEAPQVSAAKSSCANANAVAPVQTGAQVRDVDSFPVELCSALGG